MFTVESADAALIAADPALAGLREVLEPARLMERLNWEFYTVEVRYLRYKPGTSIVAGLAVTDDAGQVTMAQAFAFGGGAGDKLAKLHNYAHRDGAGPVVIDPELAAGIADATADRHLPGIRHFLRDRPGIRALVYKPGRRWVAHQPGLGSLIKIYEPGAVDGVVLRHRIAQGLPVPAVRRSSGRHGIVTSRWVPGTPLNEMPAPGRLQYRGETAELLARVHALPPGSAVVPVARAEQLTAAVQGLDAVAPRHSSAARRIAQQVGAILHAADLRVCHGDFSDDQIVVPDDGGELRLLDLDRLGLDDPHADLGSWFAAAAVAEGKAVDPGPLIEAYEAAGGRVDPHRLRLYCAGAVLQRATEPFRLRSTAWPEEIDRLMALAGELMEGKDW